jgi:hypothetical protein
MTPSQFTSKYPYSSIFRSSEHETVAMNIMVILKRTGDTFRDLSWEEYKAERLKDKDFYEFEKEYFEKVVTYCQSAEKAKTFSKSWENL